MENDGVMEEWKIIFIVRRSRKKIWGTEWRSRIINTVESKETVKEAFPVYNQKLAGYLMLNGYRLMGMEENQKYKGKNVFYFMESEKIRKSIQIYFGNSK